MNWTDWLYKHAELASQKSKDTTQVGAALVAPDGRTVLMTGYNGPPRGVRDDIPERSERPTKYLYASHAEANLIAHAARHGVRTDGCTVFTTHQPCAACCRTLIQAGIRSVVYGPGRFQALEAETEATHNMAREASMHMFTLLE